jgi:hypothetical protein
VFQRREWVNQGETADFDGHGGAPSFEALDDIGARQNPEDERGQTLAAERLTPSVS